MASLLKIAATSSFILALTTGCGGTNTDPTTTDDDQNQGGGGLGQDPGDLNLLVRNLSCTSESGDSTLNGGFVTMNTPLDTFTPQYGSIASVRKDANDHDISIDFMLHEPSSTPRGLIVLIAGGKLDAGIEGFGGDTTAAGPNFLVRSAQMFANAGFRTVTIDRPSDFAEDVSSSDANSAYDSYRTSSRHATDLSSVINAVSSGILDLPVFLAGTSRGAISAVAQQQLGAALLLSSPVTSGSGTPIGSSFLPASSINVPTRVVWHGDDQCGVTSPYDSSQFVNDLDIAGVETKGIELSGGFDGQQFNPCAADTVHGFLGIETCAVRHITDGASDILDGLPLTRPTIAAGSPQDLVAPAGSQFSLTVSATGTGPFEFSIPFNITDLQGTVVASTTEANVFIYTPPEGLDNTTDSFVYVATDANGGTSSNVIRIRIN